MEGKIGLLPALQLTIHFTQIPLRFHCSTGVQKEEDFSTGRLNTKDSSPNALFELVWREKIMADIRPSMVNAQEKWSHIKSGGRVVHVMQCIGEREHVVFYFQ